MTSRKSGKLARNVTSARSNALGGVATAARIESENADPARTIASLARRARGSSRGPAKSRTVLMLHADRFAAGTAGQYRWAHGVLVTIPRA
jgi:hypothetical protein